MPKRPKGLVQKGQAFYWRYTKHGKEHWVPLGSDYGVARRRLRDRKQDGPVSRSSLTVVALAHQWLDLCVALGRSPRNHRIAAARVTRYLEPFFGKQKVSDVTAVDLRRWRQWVEARPHPKDARRRLRPGTVKHVLGDVRTMLLWAEDERWIERSPFPRRLLPRLQEQRPDRLTDEEVARVVTLPDPYGFALRLGLGTGLRWGELCRSQAQHVENGQLVVSHTKSGRVRRVPLSPELRAELKSRVGRLVPFAEGSSGSFNAYVRRHTGIARFHVHQVRHTFACRWLERGGSLAALQELLGHTSVVTTQRYARLSEVHVRQEAERLLGREENGKMA
jgi:integrase